VDGRTEECVHWPTPELKVGDEVSIRIVADESGDSPRERTVYDPDQILRQQQEYVREMAAEWGWTIVEQRMT
jgi:hypothetical protein